MVLWHWRPFLACWCDDESVMGPTVVLARSRDNKLAAGQTMVLACGRNGGVEGRADDGLLACAMMSWQQDG